MHDGNRNIDCKKEQILVYENKFGDVVWNEHAFGTLRVRMSYLSTGQVSGRPSAYNVHIEMRGLLYRTGNVGWWDLAIMILYFMLFFVAFKGQLAALVMLPWSIWRIVKYREKVYRYWDACDLIMDCLDPLRINRDVFPSFNGLLALFSAFCRVAFHLSSMVSFFLGTAINNRDFGRSAPYAYCDLAMEDMMEFARRSARGKERMQVNPNWTPFF